MLHIILIAVPLCLIACSKEQPAPLAPAGKSADDGFGSLFDQFRSAAEADTTSAGADTTATEADTTATEADTTATEAPADTTGSDSGPEESVVADSTGSEESPIIVEADSVYSEFNIELVFVEEPIDRQILHGRPGKPFSEYERQVIRKAADIWEQIIIGDLPDYELTDYDRWLLGRESGIGGVIPRITPEMLEPPTIDDIRIYVDRHLFYYCQASPNVYREDTETYLPAVSTIGLQENHGSEEALLRNAAHEIGHALGIGRGSPWDFNRKRIGYNHHVFTGKKAVAVFEKMVGRELEEKHIRLDDVSAAHWYDNPNLNNALFVRRDGQKAYHQSIPVEISDLTVAALADLGYTVVDR